MSSTTILSRIYVSHEAEKAEIEERKTDTGMVYLGDEVGSLMAAAAKVEDRTTSRVVTPKSLWSHTRHECRRTIRDRVDLMYRLGSKTPAALRTSPQIGTCIISKFENQFLCPSCLRSWK